MTTGAYYYFLLRLEHFCDPSDKSHPKFSRVADTMMTLYSVCVFFLYLLYQPILVFLRFVTFFCSYRLLTRCLESRQSCFQSEKLLPKVHIRVIDIHGTGTVSNLFFLFLTSVRFLKFLASCQPESGSSISSGSGYGTRVLMTKNWRRKKIQLKF